MLKITLGVALGIVLASLVTTFAYMFLGGLILTGISEDMHKNLQTLNSFQANNNQLRIVPIASLPPLNQQPIVKPIGIDQPLIDFKTKEMWIKEKSKKAYTKIRKDVEDFKAQYKKPEECLDLKDSATRMRCANAYIKARRDFEALNK